MYSWHVAPIGLQQNPALKQDVHWSVLFTIPAASHAHVRTLAHLSSFQTADFCCFLVTTVFFILLYSRSLCPLQLLGFWLKDWCSWFTGFSCWLSVHVSVKEFHFFKVDAGKDVAHLFSPPGGVWLPVSSESPRTVLFSDWFIWWQAVSL